MIFSELRHCPPQARAHVVDPVRWDGDPTEYHGEIAARDGSKDAAAVRDIRQGTFVLDLLAYFSLS